MRGQMILSFTYQAGLSWLSSLPCRLGRSVGCCFAAVMMVVLPQSASAVRPVILEQSARVSSPDSAFPLNGAVALDGDMLLAGSTVLGESSSRHAAFLFARRSATSWTLVKKLLDQRTVPHAPLSVSISGGTAAISAGVRTFIFERQGGIWRLTATLRIPPGASVTSDTAVTPTVVVVGGTAEGRFVSYVYEKNASGAWMLSTRLIAGIAHPTLLHDVPQVDAVAREGVQRIVIGSPNYDPAPPSSGPQSGDAYVYQRAAFGVWNLMEGAIARPRQVPTSGEDVALAGILVFAPAGPGRAVVWDDLRFSEPPSSDPFWEQLLNSEPLDSRMNGSALSLDASEQRYVMGEPQDEDRGRHAGSATVYGRQAGPTPLEDIYIPDVKLLASNSRSGLELGRAVAFSGDIVAASSSNGVYVFDLTKAPPHRARIQEDFEDRVADGWSSPPTWSIVTHNRSAVYRQTSMRGVSTSLLGEIEWTNQSIHADVRPLAFRSSSAWAGLLVRYRDEQNYYAARLRSNQRIEIVRRLDGVTQVLGSIDATVLTNLNNRVRFEAIGTWLRVYVGGRRVLQVRDRAHRRGTVGLRTSRARAQFDNVFVADNPALVLHYQDFEDGELGDWDFFDSGEKARIVTYGKNEVFQIGPEFQEAIAGVSHHFLGPSETWDQVIESRIRVLSFAGGDEGFGFFARYPEGGISVRIESNGTISLLKRIVFQQHVLDRAAFVVTPGKWYRLRLEAVGQHYVVYVDGQPILSAIDPDMDRTAPRYGIVSGHALIEVDNFLVQRP